MHTHTHTHTQSHTIDLLSTVPCIKMQSSSLFPQKPSYVWSGFCPCFISAFVSLVLSHVCCLVLSLCFLVPAMCFPMFVCLCHVPSCCCPCLHPSPVPNLPVCLYYWFHLCPVNSPCLVHLCLCLPRLD